MTASKFRNIGRAAVLALLVFRVAAFGQEPRLTPRVSTVHPTLATGSPAPDFELPGIDDKIHKLSDYKDPFLVVMFLCNHCPTSQLYEGRKWDAGVPFTIVIAPGGKVLYQQQGDVDVHEMRRAIQANLENETYVGHPAYWAAK
jgi:hypothetical protein